METKDDFINNVQYLDANTIAQAIIKNIVTFQELQNTYLFSNQKQNEVKAIVNQIKEEANAFYNAKNQADYEAFVNKYPNSTFKAEAEKKIREEKEKLQIQRNRIFENLRKNPNAITLDLLKDWEKTYGSSAVDFLKDLCDEFGLDFDFVWNPPKPILYFGDVPDTDPSIMDIPNGYTDIFFWGIPSSGKTTALANIFTTIEAKYTAKDPNNVGDKLFGAAYKLSLKNLFRNGIGILPNATPYETTQYIPFWIKKRDEKNYRHISFFELSGELVKSISQFTYGHNFNEASNEVSNAFLLLDKLLKHDNQKIHFFFIDYNTDTKPEERNVPQQSDYLRGVATYIDNNKIFEHKTVAVYVIVTKADLIPVDDRMGIVTKYLNDNYGNFIDVLKNNCKTADIKFKIKLFSIGDVFFKRICKIDYKYSDSIIQEILEIVPPVKKNNCLQKFFNS